MASSKVSGVRIAGIASAVPGTRQPVAANVSFPAEEIERVTKTAGVMARHLAPEGVCTSDLCRASAQKLLAELGWKSDEVDALIFVTQTPDYILPATSCVLHAALGLSTSAAAFDVNLGCSGYPYGLWLAASMIRGGMRKVLLLVGETPTKIVSSQDRSVALLFGDAGTATALEAAPDASEMFFELGTDGSGAAHLMVPAGSFRRMHSPETTALQERPGGLASEEHLHMDGAEVFAFTLRRVPPLVKALLSASGWTIDEVDAFVPHQANRFMLEHLAKSMRIPPGKMILALEDYGNSSSASIPLAMTTKLQSRLASSELRLILAGFGVGFSWAGAALSAGPMVMPDLIEYAA